MTRRTHSSLQNTIPAIFGGENPCLEWKITWHRLITVGSRVRSIRRWSDSASPWGISRTRSIEEGGNRFPGKVLSSEAQEALESVSGRGARTG
jgi:hypothetical protein